MQVVGGKESPGIKRVDRRKNARRPRYGEDAQYGDGYKPDEHDRAEYLSDAGGALGLQGEKPYENQSS